MITVSSAVREALSNTFREERVVGTLTFADGRNFAISDDVIAENSISITKVCAAGDEIEFGSVVVSELKIGLRSNETRYAFPDAIIELRYELKVGNDWESIPIGHFKVVEAERNNQFVRLVCYNSLFALNKEYDNLSIGGTPYELLKHICDTCGIELGSTEAEINAFVNSGEHIQIVPESGCRTFRDCARLVAQMLGAIVDSDSVGRLVLRHFGKSTQLTLRPNQRFSSTISDYVTQYNNLKIRGESDYFFAADPDVPLGLEMVLEDAPTWKHGTLSKLQERCDALFNELKQIVYTPSNVIMPSDLTIECGDMLSLETLNGEQVNTLVTSITWQYRGKMSIESVGRSPYTFGIKPKQTAIIHELQKQSEINKLIFYEFTNLDDITIGETELETIGKITFTTIEDTSAMFLAEGLLNCDAPDVTTIREKLENVVVKNAAGEDSQLLDAEGSPYSFSVNVEHEHLEKGRAKLDVYYYLNDNLIEYRPAEELFSGEHILNLFYSFGQLKKNTVNTFEIKMKSTGGTVTIPEQRFRASITGQGLTATTAWDGKIQINEYINGFTLKSSMPLSVTDRVTVQPDLPMTNVIRETFENFVLYRPRVDISKIVESLTAGTVVTKQTLFHSMLSEWQHDTNALVLEGGRIKVRNRWNSIGVVDDTYTGGGTLVKTQVSFNGIDTIAGISADTIAGISADTIAGMEVIRNNSRNDDGTDTLQGVDWFNYNGATVANIYVSGNSWLGFGANTEHLRVNRRDSAVYSIYRQETESYLKIRWVGYSIYNSTGTDYKLIYDVYLLRTGDIVLVFREIPKSYSNGINSMENLTFTMDSAMPYVFFNKQTDGSYTVSQLNSFIMLRYLIRRNNELLKLVNDEWTVVDGELSPELFLTEGMTTVSNLDSLTEGDDFELLMWHNANETMNVPMPVVTIIGTPLLPQTITTTEYFMTDASILGIETILAEISDDVMVAISVDEGTTYKVHTGTTWGELTETDTGMTKAQLETIAVDNWGQIATTGKYRFRFVLPSTNSYFEKLTIDYLN